MEESSLHPLWPPLLPLDLEPLLLHLLDLPFPDFPEDDDPPQSSPLWSSLHPDPDEPLLPDLPEDAQSSSFPHARLRSTVAVNFAASI